MIAHNVVMPYSQQRNKGMCEDTVILPIPNVGGFIEVPIDKCIAPVIKALNDAGIETLESCCGHGQSGSIDLKDGRRIVILPAEEQEVSA